MWFKVLAQLGDLLPHLSRLVPMLQRVIDSRTSPDGTVIEGFTTSIRNDLGQVSSSNAALARVLESQGRTINDIQEDVRHLHSVQTGMTQKIQGIEIRVQTISTWIKLAVGMLAVILVLAIIFLVKHL